MFNNRPIQDRRLQKALDEIKQVYARYGFAGSAMVISEDEAAYTYAMHAPWSAIRYDRDAPMGWRLRAISSEDGKELTEKRVLGAMHTICQLNDYGMQTEVWMEDLKRLCRDSGIDFTHTPFNGVPVPHIYLGTPPTPQET